MNSHLFFYLFQILEQERHTSRRKLEIVQEECDSKILELQGDISELKKTLDFRENVIKQIEKDKTQLIEDLTAQNQRLKAQLKEVGIRIAIFWIDVCMIQAFLKNIKC